MSYDLFGDLPTLKGSSTSTSATAATTATKSKEQQKQESLSTATTTQIGKDDHSDNKNKKSTIVGALGNAGTTKFFLPAALLRKRQSTSLHQQDKAIKRQTITVDSHSNKLDTTKNAGNNNNNHHDDESEEKNSSHQQQQPIPNTIIQKEEKEEKEEETTNTKEQDFYTESKALQNLHSSLLQQSSSIKLYDPLKPNDYLAYRQSKENELIRANLEKQAKKTLEMQKRLRDQISKERKLAEATGDVDTIIKSRVTATTIINNNSNNTSTTSGVGRGRGMSNLPAWLIKKQQQQQDKLGETSAKNTTVKDTKKGYTVVLNNMVGPGEVDNALSNEVKEECELQCGEVLRVTVNDANDEYKEVRVFVTFQNAAHAKKAASVFNGRVFGNRKITSQLL